MKKKGFTLVEVIVVLAIIAILMLLIVPNVFALIDKNKEKSCNSLISNIKSATKIYVTNNKYELDFTCGSPKEIKLQTLVDSGDLKLEGVLTNPINNETVELSNTVTVIYDCESKEFIYSVNGISCNRNNNECDGVAVPPTIQNKVYNGSEQTGVTGGENVDIIGSKKGTNIGSYNVTVIPKDNYCWSDNSKVTRNYIWTISENKPNITLEDKTVVYTGNRNTIDNAIVKNSSGNIINDIPVVYTYHSGEDCTGSIITDDIINVGNYSVKAYTNDYGSYNSSSSNCAKLTIERATPTLTTSKSSINLNYPDSSSFTYTYTGDGEVSCSSSNSNIATCSIDTTAKTISVTDKKPGTANIIVTSSQSANYNSVSKSVSVKINGLENTLSVTANNGLIYNKNAQTLVSVSNAEGTVYYSTANALTSSNYTSGSTIVSTGINAGAYTVYYYTPGNDYYKAKQGSVNVSIGKASCTCSISSVSETMEFPGSTSGTVNYSCTGDGTRSIASSNTNVVKAGAANTTSASLTAVGTGTSTLTLNQSVGSNYNACTSSSKSVTVNPSTYTVSYNANGGSGAPSSQTKTYGVDLTLSSTVPTRDGYSFLGWSTSNSATSATYASSGTYSSNSSATLYAVWKINTYTVSYNANGGSGAPSSQTKTHGVDLTLSSTKPSKTGHTFLGWNSSSSATSATYASGGTYSSNSSVTLYAVWQPHTYTISYNANGGSGAPSSQTKTYGVNLTLSNTVPTRSGYSFLGWSTSSSATSATYSRGGTYSSNSAATLYAVWAVSCSGNSGSKEFSTSNGSKANGFKGRLYWRSTCNSDGTIDFDITDLQFYSTYTYGYTFYLDGYIRVNGYEAKWCNAKASGPFVTVPFTSTGTWYSIQNNPYFETVTLPSGTKSVTIKFEKYNYAYFAGLYGDRTFWVNQSFTVNL